jgi:hypothetical protein
MSKDAMSSVLDVIGSCYQGQQPAHTDHPLRHFDRTCPACVAEGQSEKPQRAQADTFPFPREVEHWRERALKAEARLSELEASAPTENRANKEER